MWTHPNITCKFPTSHWLLKLINSCLPLCIGFSFTSTTLIQMEGDHPFSDQGFWCMVKCEGYRCQALFSSDIWGHYMLLWSDLLSAEVPVHVLLLRLLKLASRKLTEVPTYLTTQEIMLFLLWFLGEIFQVWKLFELVQFLFILEQIQCPMSRGRVNFLSF